MTNLVTRRWSEHGEVSKAAEVLLRIKSSGLLDEDPNLAAHVARGEARPA
jgi:hypothetical protein